jgi:mRNA interferase MazF
MEINQYALILVNLDPTLGSEIQKTRPCVVVSPNEMNKHLKTVVVCPLTTNLNDYPTRIPVHFQNKNSMIAVDQIRTIDKIRIVKILGELQTSEIQDCKQIIKEIFVD